MKDGGKLEWDDWLMLGFQFWIVVCIIGALTVRLWNGFGAWGLVILAGLLVAAGRSIWKQLY